MAKTAKIIIIGGEASDILEKLYRLAGIEADYAACEKEAGKQLKQNAYDMVILNLPDDEAIAALPCVREISYRHTYMPVIALTQKEDMGFFTEKGVNGVLSKPVDENTLAALLRKWLQDEKIGQLAGGSAPLNDTIKAASEGCGLNVRLALARLNGMQRVLDITMKAVGASVPARLEKLEEALAGSEQEEFVTVIHGMKSSFASIGAVALADLAAELEYAGKVGDMELCTDKFHAFKAEADKLGERLREIYS